MGQPLRDYQRAILDALSDGEEHSRESLLAIGTRACSPEHALAMFQRAQRSPSRVRAPVDFENMSTEERLAEMARQEVLGARMQAQKAISHLEDRGFSEAVKIEMRGTRPFRMSFRITDLGRARLVEDDGGPKVPRGKSPKARNKLTKAERSAIRSAASKKAIATRRARGDDLSEQGKRSTQTRIANGENLSETNKKIMEKRLAKGEDISGTGRRSAETRRKNGEDLSATARRAWEKRRASGEDISATQKAAVARMREEGRDFSKNSLKGWETRRKNDAEKGISWGERMAAIQAARTPEERSAAAKRGTQTRIERYGDEAYAHLKRPRASKKSESDDALKEVLREGPQSPDELFEKLGQWQVDNSDI